LNSEVIRLCELRNETLSCGECSAERFRVRAAHFPTPWRTPAASAEVREYGSVPKLTERSEPLA
jgi:hypothetical protein